MINKTKIIIWALILGFGFFLLTMPQTIGSMELGEYINIVQFVGLLIISISALVLTILIFSWIAKTNKYVRWGIYFGLIFAIPFFFTLTILEIGVYTDNNGICPNHQIEDQTPGLSDETICKRRASRGITEGEIIAAHVCVDGIYYQTNYRCITKTLGFFESEAPVFFIWIYLAEVYTAIIGAGMGWVVSKIKKNKKEHIKKSG